MRSKIVLFAAVLAFVLFVRSCAQWTQASRLADALPGFECPGLRVETVEANYAAWTGRQFRGLSVLHMPDSCRARLERMVAAPPYAAAQCPPGRQCRSLAVDGTRYQFELGGQRILFRHSSDPSR